MINFFLGFLKAPVVIAYRLRGLDFPATSNTYRFRGLRRLRDNPASAIADFDRAILMNPTDALAHHSRGMANELRGDYECAILDYGSAIQYEPNYAPTYFNRGGIFHRKGDYNSAIEDYELSSRLDPNNLSDRKVRIASAYNNRGLTYYERGEHDLAISDFGKAICLDYEDHNALENRGRCFEAKGDLSLAADDFEAVHRILWPELYETENLYDTEDIDLDLILLENKAAAHGDRAMYHFSCGDYDLAVAWLGSAIGIDPSDDAGYYNRALIYFAKGEYDRAIADLNTVIGLAGSLEAYAKRDEAYAAMGGDPTEAEAFMRRGLAYISEDSQGPSDDGFHVVILDHMSYYPGLIADSLLLKFNLAIADFDAALYFDPEKVEAYKGRGRVNRMKGDYQLADEDFREADRLEAS